MVRILPRILCAALTEDRRHLRGGVELAQPIAQRLLQLTRLDRPGEYATHQTGRVLDDEFSVKVEVGEQRCDWLLAVDLEEAADEGLADLLHGCGWGAGNHDGLE